MDEQYTKLIKNIEEIRVPEHLKDHIVMYINKIDMRQRRFKLAIFSISATLSLIFSYFAVKYLITKIEETGFGQYISLLFSGSEISLYWKELTYSIIESVPTVGLIIFLATIALFIWSSLKIIKIKTQKLAFGF